jgi:hypothetical protein
MTHLTQHFTDKEMVTVFHTIKNKRIVIFDALTWQGKAGERNIKDGNQIFPVKLKWFVFRLN